MQKKKASLDDFDSVDDDQSVEDRFIVKELSQRALLCLHGMEEPYKEVFMWRVYAELSFKEIALIFGKNENWACVTYHRARKLIKERLESEKNEK